MKRNSLILALLALLSTGSRAQQAIVFHSADKPLSWEGQKCELKWVSDPIDPTSGKQVGMVTSTELSWEYIRTTEKMEPFDFSQKKYLAVTLLAPRNGKVLAKLETFGNTFDSKKVEKNVRAGREWQTIYFDMSGAPAGKFDRLSLFFDFSSTRSGEQWYFATVVQTDNAPTATAIRKTEIRPYLLK